MLMSERRSPWGRRRGRIGNATLILGGAAVCLALAACSNGEAETRRARTAETSSSVAAPATKPAETAIGVEPGNGMLNIDKISGEWRVAHVGVLVSGPVQALGIDDPTFMGRTIRIAADRLSWEPPGPRQADADTSSCDSPSLMLSGENLEHAIGVETLPLGISPDMLSHPAFDVTCAGEGDSAYATVSVLPDGRMIMTWLDGALLVLTRH